MTAQASHAQTRTECAYPSLQQAAQKLHESESSSIYEDLGEGSFALSKEGTGAQSQEMFPLYGSTGQTTTD